METNTNIININNTTIDAEVQGTAVMVNRLADFYHMTEHAYDTFFAEYQDTDSILDMQKELKRLNKVIEEKSKEYGDMLSQRYNGKFTPVTQTSLLKYESSRGKSVTVYFDFSSGLPVYYGVEEADKSRYGVTLKNGDISIVVGYCYELGAVVTRHYSYKINQNNSSCNFKLLSETIIPMLENRDMQTYYTDSKEVFAGYKTHADDALSHVKAQTFLQTMYNLPEDRVINMSLKKARKYILNNKSFEIILKTAPLDMVVELAKRAIDKAMPVHKILNMEKTTYQKCVDKGLLNKFVALKEILANCNEENVKNHLNKTDEEWLELIEDNEHWEENFKFYGIDWNKADGLLGSIIKYYVGLDRSNYSYTYDCGTYGSIICKYYKFGKFLGYVHDGAVDQGYTSVNNFYTQLRDYLRMCEAEDSVPTLFSSYLSQTHNIMSRNHKIKVEKEQEEIFNNRYNEFKKYTSPDGAYVIIRPKDTNDMKREGDVLNHCVASYIKRVIDGECLIYFLRKADNEDASLVTIEVADDVIKQTHGLHNREITDEERGVLSTFATRRHLKMSV